MTKSPIFTKDEVLNTSAAYRETTKFGLEKETPKPEERGSQGESRVQLRGSRTSGSHTKKGPGRHSVKGKGSGRNICRP